MGMGDFVSPCVRSVEVGSMTDSTSVFVFHFYYQTTTTTQRNLKLT